MTPVRKVASLTAALTLLVVAAVAAYTWRWTETDEPENKATTPCDYRAPLPRTVADINQLIYDTRRSENFMGADVGLDVQLSDKRALWIFGDTLRAASFNGPRFVSNSMLMVQPGCGRVVMPSNRGAVIPNRSDGVAYWPMSIGAVAGPNGDLVGVGLMRVKRIGEGVFDFQILGPAFARFLVPRGGEPELLAVEDAGPDQVDDKSPMWGAAVTVTADWVYLYGTAHPGDDEILGWSLHLARAKITDLTDIAAWQFWDGKTWANDDRRLGTLIPAKDGVSRILSVFEQDGSWYAVSKRNEVLGNQLVIWKAKSPTGPFGTGRAVADLPSTEEVLTYMPLAHPAILPEPGSVVVSWSRNVADLEKVAEDPTLYRPEFARVELP